MGTTVRIAVDQFTNKPTKVYVKFDDEQTGKATIDKSADVFARSLAGVNKTSLVIRKKKTTLHPKVMLTLFGVKFVQSTKRKYAIL